MDWLKAGDLSTSYFHSRANQSNRRNYISSLVLDDGSILEEEKCISEAFVGYFGNLYQSANTTYLDPILQGIESKVIDRMNVELIRPFTTTEEEQSLKQMKPITAPGLDGMRPLFFKSYWNIVGTRLLMQLYLC